MFMDTHSHPKQNVQLFVRFGVLPYGSYGMVTLEQMQMLPAVILDVCKTRKFHVQMCRRVFFSCIVFLCLNIKISSFIRGLQLLLVHFSLQGGGVCIQSAVAKLHH